MLARLYAILDAQLLTACSLQLTSVAAEFRMAGITLIQYRNKQASARAMLNDAAMLRKIFAGDSVKLLLNDRPDLALLASFQGVHVGQEDVPAEGARCIVGADRWVGVSTHSLQQVIEADETSCDYIAYGPIFSTATKSNPEPTVGLAGLKQARAHTSKPLVAIGGITRKNCQSVLDGGADSVAVISDLLPIASGSSTSRPTPRQIAEEFLSLLS